MEGDLIDHRKDGRVVFAPADGEEPVDHLPQRYIATCLGCCIGAPGRCRKVSRRYQKNLAVWLIMAREGPTFFGSASKISFTFVSGTSAAHLFGSAKRPRWSARPQLPGRSVGAVRRYVDNVVADVPAT